MEIILLEDVKALGKKGDKVTVNEGYARNFIIPKKLGLEATPKNLNDLKLQKQKADKIALEQLEEAKALKAKLEEQSIKMQIKLGEGGKSFGAITGKEIAAELKSQRNLEIDKKKINLPESIKNPGVFHAEIRLHKDVKAELKVEVTGI
jgi:large subunit ribosomal protein L9